MLTNMFSLDYTPAVTLSGKIGNFNYYTGVFSNDTSRDMGDSFTNLDSGLCPTSPPASGISARPSAPTPPHIHLSYLHSEANENASLMTRFGRRRRRGIDPHRRLRIPRD